MSALSKERIAAVLDRAKYDSTSNVFAGTPDTEARELGETVIALLAERDALLLMEGAVRAYASTPSDDYAAVTNARVKAWQSAWALDALRGGK